MLLLVNPPVVKPSEPPPGISRLMGAMNAHGVKCVLWDANLELLLSFLQIPRVAAGNWTSRAVRNCLQNIESLKSREVYRNKSRYTLAVRDLNRLLASSPSGATATVSLTDYHDPFLSPLRSLDLLAAAEAPEKNVFHPLFSRLLAELLEKEKPSAVGFSLNYLSQALTAFAMMGFLRKMDPSLILLVGGGLATSWMSKPDWKNPFSGLVDHMIAGPGEKPILSLMMAGKDVHPFPFTHDYSALPTNHYLAPGRVLPYSASTGCYWNKCGFCPERAERNPYVPLPADTAAADLQKLVAEHSPVLIHLLDNALSPALLEKLVEQPPGAPWYGFVRLTDHLADEGFCRELERSGCVMLQLGLESGDQSVLEQEHKGVSLGTASRALKALKRAGIATYVYLLFGTPSETGDSARKTLGYTVEHSGCIDFLNLAIFNLPIHSPEAEHLGTEAFSHGDLSLYSGFVHPKGWNRGLVRQFLQREFKRHPAIASILRNDPPHFTSNHAPFFCRDAI